MRCFPVIFIILYMSHSCDSWSYRAVSSNQGSGKVQGYQGNSAVKSYQGNSAVKSYQDRGLDGAWSNRTKLAENANKILTGISGQISTLVKQLQMITGVVKENGLLFKMDVLKGFEKAGDCLKFGPNDNRRNLITGMEWFCLEDSNNNYCLNFPCPLNNCTTPQSGGQGKCDFCPGTCVHGGVVYKVGDRIIHSDKKNRCNCGPAGRLGCSRLPRSYQVMCNVK